MKSALPALLLLAALTGCSGAHHDPAQEAPAAASALRQTGRWFTDAQGRAVILHGVNITTPQTADGADLAARYGDDADFLAAQGFNVVRLAIFLSGLAPTPNGFDESYLAPVAALVQRLTAAGLYVIVDFHQDLYSTKYHGRGMAEWMAVDNGLPNLPDAGNLFLNYADNPAVQRAFDNFWSDADAPDGVSLQTHYAQALQHVARRFQDNPRVLGYEIMNEPFPGSQFLSCASPAGCPLFDLLSLTRFVRNMSTALRAVDAEKILFYEPNVTFDFGANTWLGSSRDPNAGFSFHDYCLADQFGALPVDDSACGPVGEQPQFGYALAHAQRAGAAPILTEFGMFTASADFDTGPVVRRLAALADGEMVSWAYWHYDGASSYTLVADPEQSPAGVNLYANIVDAVVRPYPRAVAGTPLAFSFDPDTRTFTLDYTPFAAVGGGTLAPALPTELAVPARVYPHGYVLSVTGGQVVDDGSAAPKILAAAAATAVHVSILPR